MADDPRFSRLEGERTALHDGPYRFNEHRVEVIDGELRLTLGFDSPFPGSVALERWLRTAGRTSVEITYGFT